MDDACPFCGEEVHRDEVDVGVGTIKGPAHCMSCGAYEDETPAPEGWAPPVQGDLDELQFGMLMGELLILRSLERATRSAGPKRTERIAWALQNLDEHRVR
jgi:hypothetical protein